MISFLPVYLNFVRLYLLWYYIALSQNVIQNTNIRHLKVISNLQLVYVAIQAYQSYEYCILRSINTSNKESSLSKIWRYKILIILTQDINIKFLRKAWLLDNSAIKNHRLCIDYFQILWKKRNIFQTSSTCDPEVNYLYW